ncbi:MAG TPA: 50S ribosomal protein L29 [Coleofasciculaceae cyanobacterium]
MPLPKIDEVRDLSEQELEEQIVATKRQLFELRFQKGTRRLEKNHEFKHARHRLAQLMTVERERQLTAASSKPVADTE